MLAWLAQLSMQLTVHTVGSVGVYIASTGALKPGWADYTTIRCTRFIACITILADIACFNNTPVFLFLFVLFFSLK